MRDYQPDEAVWVTAQPVLDPANPSNRMSVQYVYTQAIVLETHPEENRIVLGLQGGNAVTLTFSGEEHEKHAIHRGALPPTHERRMRDLLEQLRKQQIRMRFQSAWRQAVKDLPLIEVPAEENHS